jgi:hypothetical protein
VRWLDLLTSVATACFGDTRFNFGDQIQRSRCGPLRPGRLALVAYGFSPYNVTMIDVNAENGVVHVDFSTEGMSPEQVNEFVTWLRVEAIARRSKLSEEAAWLLSEEVKAGWWDKNKWRFGN